MKAKPILFTGENVRAILENRKSMTRRVIKVRVENNTRVGPIGHQAHIDSPEALAHCPYGGPGDLLYVRETWQAISPDENYRSLDECRIIYKATDKHPGYDALAYAEHHDLSVSSPIWSLAQVYPWRPSIFMPRWASRLTLRVNNVRVERLQEISEDDAVAEGIHDTRNALSCGRAPQSALLAPSEQFEMLWNSINAKRGYSWESNPWVWVIEWDKVWHQNVDEVMKAL